MKKPMFLLVLILSLSAAFTRGARGIDPLPKPAAGEAAVWYLGHCGYAVRTQNNLLIFDYKELRDGQQPSSRPAQPSLADGWIDPAEIKDLRVRVFVSHSHEDHYDPVIFTWKEIVPDIAYYFGWKAADDPSSNYLVGPRAELKSSGLEIATINSHHSGIPEVAWLVKVDGLVIYHNGDCQPGDPISEHDFIKTKTDVIDLAFVFPVYEDGQKYTAQTTDFFTKFHVRAAFPMHAPAGDAMYLGFEKAFQAKFPGLPIHVPMKLGQKFVFEKGADQSGMTEKDQQTPRQILSGEIGPGQAIVWYLYHSGWAVKTKNHLLIFDYTEPPERPTQRSLDSGSIEPSEIGDQNVTVFVSHRHVDHFDPLILDWRAAVKNIRYVWGWEGENSPTDVHFGLERKTVTPDGLEILNIHNNLNGIPESAFLAKADGLTILHAGDHGHRLGMKNPAFKDNILYLAGQAPRLDLFFTPTFGGEIEALRALKPRVVFPMHEGGREHQYSKFAQKIKALGLDVDVGAAEKPGSRFFYSEGKLASH